MDTGTTCGAGKAAAAPQKTAVADIMFEVTTEMCIEIVIF
jgi:hypothetical protein